MPSLKNQKFQADSRNYKKSGLKTHPSTALKYMLRKKWKRKKIKMVQLLKKKRKLKLRNTQNTSWNSQILIIQKKKNARIVKLLKFLLSNVKSVTLSDAMNALITMQLNRVSLLPKSKLTMLIKNPLPLQVGLKNFFSKALQRIMSLKSFVKLIRRTN